MAFGSVANRVASHLYETLRYIYQKLLRFVGPDDAHTRPRRETAVWSLLGFFVFLLMASLVVQFPSRGAHNTFVTLSSVIISGLFICLCRDLIRRGFIMKASLTVLTSTLAKQGEEYRRNLGNTVFTVLFSMILLTVVCSLVWYPSLQVKILQLSEHIEVRELNLTFSNLET